MAGINPVTTSTLDAAISTKRVSIFKSTSEEKLKDYFRLIAAYFLALALIKGVTFVLEKPVGL